MVTPGWMWWNAAVMEKGRQTHRACCSSPFAPCAVYFGVNKQKVLTSEQHFNRRGGIWLNNQTFNNAANFWTKEVCRSGIWGRVLPFLLPTVCVLTWDKAAEVPALLLQARRQSRASQGRAESRGSRAFVVRPVWQTSECGYAYVFFFSAEISLGKYNNTTASL